MACRPHVATVALAVAIGACRQAEQPGDAAQADALRSDAAVDAIPIDAPKFCDSETRDDTYAAGLTKVGANGYSIVLVSSTPAPPQKGNNAWVVQVLHPAPVDGLHLRVVPFMPDHGHGTAVVPVITPAANGTYNVSPVNLFMTGFWSVRIDLLDAANQDTELDHAAFLFCVSSN